MTFIGNLTSAHGITGDIVLEHDVADVDMLLKQEAFMIELLPNSFIPFFLVSVKKHNEQSLLVHFEEINSRESTKSVLHKKVYLHQELDIKRVGANAWLHVIGFEIMNNQHAIGIVEDILPQGKNALIQTTYREREVLLPLSEDLIDKIDTKRKIIHLQIVEGLLEL